MVNVLRVGTRGLVATRVLARVCARVMATSTSNAPPMVGSMIIPRARWIVCDLLVPSGLA